ncbi:hypothetical protein STEG23_002108, partial [Scotinomys teguina]
MVCRYACLPQLPREELSAIPRLHCIDILPKHVRGTSYAEKMSRFASHGSEVPLV